MKHTFNQIDHYYGIGAHCDHPECHTLDPMALDISGYESVLVSLAKRIHEGTLNPKDLSPELIDSVYNDLNEAASKGYGSGWSSPGTIEKPSRQSLMLQRNVYRFSGAKTYSMMVELNSKLTQDGKVLAFNEFKQEALKINKAYNLNYLQAEYQTATHAAKMAANWEAYQRNTDLFPNLKYKTQGDDRVSDDHRSLEGTIAPINSDFWDKYYPPNRWRCRCYVVQTAQDPTEDIPTDLEFVKPEFRINSGKKQELIAEKGKKAHPFFQLSQRDSKGNKQLLKAFELTKLNAPYNLAYQAKNNSKVKVNPFTDQSEYERNFVIATRLADQLNDDIELRPHLNARIILNQSNPEYIIGGKIADRKSPQGNRGISNTLKSASEQGCELVVFDLSSYKLGKSVFISELTNRLNNKENYPNISEIIIVDQDLSVERISRVDLTKKDR